MSQEKDAAIRSVVGPYRGLAQLGCQTFLVLALTFAYLGHWSWIGWLFVAGIIAAFSLGSWVYSQGPADETQRRVFNVCLTMAGMWRSDGRVLRMTGWTILPALMFITLASGNRQFVVAASRMDLAWIIRKLRSPRAFDRWRAVVALDKLGGDGVIAELRQCLGDEDPGVREAVVSALSRRDNPAAEEELSRIVNSCADDIEWLTALSGLCRLGRAPQVDMPRVIRAANLIRSDAELEGARLGPLLSTLPAALVGDMIRAEVGSTGWSEMTRNLLRQKSPEAIEIVREALNDSGDREILRTLMAMRNEAPIELKPEMERLANHPSDRIRWWASLHLKRFDATSNGTD